MNNQSLLLLALALPEVPNLIEQSKTLRVSHLDIARANLLLKKMRPFEIEVFQKLASRTIEPIEFEKESVGSETPP